MPTNREVSLRDLPLLDLFVLLLVQKGLNTLYRLKRCAGISIGAASPSLLRLKEEKHIYLRATEKTRKKDSSPERAQRPYGVGTAAAFCLNFEDWLTPRQEKVPRDVESLARLVALAAEKDRPDLAANLLRKAIAQRAKRGQHIDARIERPRVAARYVSIVTACESARAKAEAGVLKKILKTVKY